MEMEMLQYLSDREIQVFRLIIKGKQNREIASELFISERTVKFHCANIYTKVGVKNRIELIFTVQQELAKNIIC